MKQTQSFRRVRCGSAEASARPASQIKSHCYRVVNKSSPMHSNAAIYENLTVQVAKKLLLWKYHWTIFKLTHICPNLIPEACSNSFVYTREKVLRHNQDKIILALLARFRIKKYERSRRKNMT